MSAIALEEISPEALGLFLKKGLPFQLLDHGTPVAQIIPLVEEPGQDALLKLLNEGPVLTEEELARMEEAVNQVNC